MAVEFTNAWKENVKDNVVSSLRNQIFPIPVYSSKESKIRGNQFIVFKGEISESLNTMSNLINNEFSVLLHYYMFDHRRNDTTIRKFFNQVSKIEESIYSLLEIDPLYEISINNINYEDDEEFNGYRRAEFEITVNNSR